MHTPSPSVPVVPGIIPVDTLMTGRDRVTCAYLVEADEPTLIEAGPATSAGAMIDALTSIGLAPSELAHIVLTHIHLDHAGGAGHLATHFPNATIWIHENAAAHLVDPTRLVASATRVYGEGPLSELFGLPRPIPADRVRALAGGDVLQLGNRSLTAIATPGHASSHLAIQDADSGVVCTGDAVGVHLPEVDVLRPAAPPPEFDIEQAISSIQVIEERARGALLFAHFGPVWGVEGICAQAIDRIRTWGEVARLGYERGGSIQDISEDLRAHAAGVEGTIDDANRERFEIVGSFEMSAKGLERYWRKRGEAHPPSKEAPGSS